VPEAGHGRAPDGRGYAIFATVRRAYLLIVLIGLLGASATAQESSSLYLGEAPANVGDGDQAPLLAALNQVLIRLTGRVGSDPVAELQIDAARAEQLTLGRAFRQQLVPRENGEPVAERRLRVEFDPVAVNRLIDQAGWRRWGSERPQMLLWMVSDDLAGTGYLQPDARLRHALEQAEFEYGLNLVLPILDANDRIEVTPADVRGGFTMTSIPALERYGADGVIMLGLRRNANFWSGRWAWRIEAEEQAFQRSGATPVEVIELGLARITESLAARFAARTDGEETLLLEVAGMTGMQHYKAVTDFLAGLTGVKTVRLISAQADRLRFRLVSFSPGLRRRIELTGPLAFERIDLVRGVVYYRFRL